MAINEFVSEDLVIFTDKLDKDALLGEVADLLEERAKTKSTYKQAVIDREKVYPTGLATEHSGIALPHTDSIHVDEPAVAIAILENKVPFVQMGSDSDIVDVEVIFMLALKKAEDQLELLQTFVELIQDEDLMNQIKTAKDAKSVIATIEQFSAKSLV